MPQLAGRLLARLAVLLAVLAPAALRPVLEAPAARACEPEGRGEPPRHWLGCVADPGPARPLADDERLVLGRPVDPNTADPAVLAHVPGLSRALAREIVRDRELNGPFASVADLERVRGVGPKRLAQARTSLSISRGPAR